jgi:hypothetical protein
MVEKNIDKQGETGHVLSEENEQKQEGDSDMTAGREAGGNQQVMNKMAEEGKGGEDGIVIIILVKVEMSLCMSHWTVSLAI